MNEKLWKRERRRRSFAYFQNKRSFIKSKKIIKQLVVLEKRRSKFKNNRNNRKHSFLKRKKASKQLEKRRRKLKNNRR